MEVGVAEFLSPRLSAASQLVVFAGLFAIGVVAEVPGRGRDALAGDGPAVFEAEPVVDAAGAIERVEIFAVGINEPDVGERADVAIQAADIITCARELYAGSFSGTICPGPRSSTPRSPIAQSPSLPVSRAPYCGFTMLVV